jgi:hypothetical protein
LIFPAFPRTTLLTMSRILSSISFVLVFVACLVADSNLHITDVGLHGSYGTPSVVRLIVRNPSPQSQVIHLKVATSNENADVTNTVTIDVPLSGGEQRALELPVLVFVGRVLVTADASSGSAFFGQDKHEETLRQTNLIVLMCTTESVCKMAQSQAQFSGTVEERADKNRQTAFEIVDDPREHWWAYSASSAVVLAMPIAKLTPAQRDALEGFLRSGGRMVLLEDEIADPSFLSAYRTGPPRPNGERVGKGTLFRVSGLNANALGDVFAGHSLTGVLQRYNWQNSNQFSFLNRRFATSFDFPSLRWILIWLATYAVVIGVLNFAVLRHFRRLEFGWISMCGLALLFAAGFYFSSASRRPKDFRLDNLATYYLDARSSLAAADYNLRVSAPDRQALLVSVVDPAVFTYSNRTGEDSNSQIWAEMNRRGAPERHHQYDIHLDPPSRVELQMLKWSFQDLDLLGLHEFPGTVHFVAPNRLRNDTGQRFGEAVYLDYTSNALYALPALAPGEEIQLDAITPRPIRTQDSKQVWTSANLDYRKQTLPELALAGALPFVGAGRVFAGLGDGPALPVELNIPHQQAVHSLVIVALEQQMILDQQ